MSPESARKTAVGLTVLMIPLLLYATYVQLNDVDPLEWIALYLGAALLSGLAMWHRFRAWPLLIVGAVGLVWAGILAPRVIGKQSLVESEEGRELFGCLIVGVWMIAAFFLHRRAKAGS